MAMVGGRRVERKFSWPEDTLVPLLFCHSQWGVLVLYILGAGDWGLRPPSIQLKVMATDGT